MTIKEKEFNCVIHDTRLNDIEQKVDKLSADISDLVDAWKAAAWVVSFVKWCGGIATAITAIYAVLKLKGL